MRQLRIDLRKCEEGRKTCHHECESACAEQVFKFEDPGRAALHIHDIAAGGTRAILCDQCGDCIEVCPTEALKRNKLGVVMLDKKLCVGCFQCIGFCDKDAFERAPGALEPHKCIACTVCVKACPHGALEIAEVPEPVRPYKGLTRQSA